MTQSGAGPWVLGFDAGGTQTRWALAEANGKVRVEGSAPGFSAIQMQSEDGRAQVKAALAELAGQALPHGRPQRVHGGLTGFGGDAAALQEAVGLALALPAEAITLSNDIEIAYRDAFAPGEGYLVYAGTGSIASFIDARGEFHRAGGRGYVLDDAGGGVWIAKEALRRIWRAEDEAPDSWRASAMAREVFDQLGGSDWAVTRQFVYAGDRGQLGRLALAVARAADRDAVALEILQQAGSELARLGRALANRFGARPVCLSGRVAQLHPAIEEYFRAGLPVDTNVVLRVSQGHHAAARIAARGLVATA